MFGVRVGVPIPSVRVWRQHAHATPSTGSLSQRQQTMWHATPALRKKAREQLSPLVSATTSAASVTAAAPAAGSPPGSPPRGA